MTDLDQLKQLIRQFRDERDWMQFHNPKNLACAISIESAELLEHFQWKSPEESDSLTEAEHAAVSYEIADIAIYLIELADNLNLDLINVIKDKLELNKRRYPISKSKGNALKYTALTERKN